MQQVKPSMRGGCCGGSTKCNKTIEASAARASVHVLSDFGETHFFFDIDSYVNYIQAIGVKEGSVIWKDIFFTSDTIFTLKRKMLCRNGNVSVFLGR